MPSKSCICLPSIYLTINSSSIPSVQASIPISPFIYPSVPLSICSSMHPSTFPSFFPSIYPSIHLVIHPPIHPFIHSFIHSSVRPSVYPFIPLSFNPPSIHQPHNHPYTHTHTPIQILLHASHYKPRHYLSTQFASCSDLDAPFSHSHKTINHFGYFTHAYI